MFKHQHQPWTLPREDRDRDHLHGERQKAVVGFGGKIKAAQATTTAAVMIQEETDMETETGIEKENVTEVVTAIMEIDDAITAIAREIVVAVTDTRAAQDRDLLDDTILDQKTQATSRRETTRRKRKKPRRPKLQLERDKNSSLFMSTTAWARNQPFHACLRTRSGSSSS